MTRALCLRPYRAAAAILFTALSSAGFATAATSSIDRQIETIVVTAHRIPSSTPVVPVVILEPVDSPAANLDVLRNIPSFAVSQSGGLGSLTEVRVRGAEANHLLVLVDGFDVMDPSADSGFNFANLNLAGVSRIEYLPGAQSAIWGNHALAGVLQLTTEPNRRIRRLGLEGGSFDSRSTSLNLADATDDHYYNVSVADFATDGTNIARAGNEQDGYQNTSWFASGGLHGDNWTVRTLVRRVATESDIDPWPYPTYLPADGNNQNSHDEMLYAIGLDLHGQEHGWQQQLRASVFDTDNTDRVDGSQVAETSGRRVKFSSVTALPLSASQDLIVLLEHQEEQFRQQGEASFYGDPNQQQSFDTTSAGIEYLVRPLPRWAFSVSGRHDWASDFEDSDSVRLGARYQWREELLFWAALGTGIKQPSFTERFGYTPDTFIGNPDLKAEQNQHVSIGAEYRSNSWLHTLTLYRDRLENEINGYAFDIDSGSFTAENDNGSTRHEGVEWSSELSWSAGHLRLGASHLESEDTDGSGEIRRPTWQALTEVAQAWGRLSASIGAFYIDSRDDFDFADWPAQRVELDDYTLVHTALTFELRPGVTIGMRGENLLDKTYEDILGYRGRGRAWYLTLGVDR